MSWRSVLLGRRLASAEEKSRRIGAILGISTFGLDALGSAAYGPEATLTALRPLGPPGVGYAMPLMAAIVGLLAVVLFSYRQTIAAYPGGGGAYTVSRENLGAGAGLFAAAALMVDYMLNVAVGISTGVGALVSAVPSLQAHTLVLCLGILGLLALANLRGLRDAGTLWLLPTALFVASLAGMLGVGFVRGVLAGGHPAPVTAVPALPPAAAAASPWLLLRAFANGCTAMTGIEAVSNGVPAFRDPIVPTARRSLVIIGTLLAILLGGITILCRLYHIGATEPGAPGYQSVLSQLAAAVTGRGLFYHVVIAAVLALLALSANTSFAGFPRLCRLLALDGYLPYHFARRGSRLVFTEGIYVLTLAAALLLVAFGGVTDRLIPLFAVGALLSFTFSQAGMVMHARKKGGNPRHAILSAIGALATAATVVIVVVAKFHEGAWITLLAIPLLVGMMAGLSRHYRWLAAEIAPRGPFQPGDLRPPIVVVPIDEWNRVSQKALRFALTLSNEVFAVHVDCGEDHSDLAKNWEKWVTGPALAARMPEPKLISLPSPYRRLIEPIITYVLDLERREKDRHVAVVISELTQRHGLLRVLHNQRAVSLTRALLQRGDRRINVVNVPWYLDE